MAPKFSFGSKLKRVPLPPALTAALGPDEQVRLVVELVGGEWLAASRFGLWIVTGDSALRWNWDLISKARLVDRTLTVVVAVQLELLPSGLVVLVDQPPRSFELLGPHRLTDDVHSRVRRSVAASRYLAWPRAGGWVVLRRIPGRDGLTRQIRLDPGADVLAPGFLEAVAEIAVELEAPFAMD